MGHVDIDDTSFTSGCLFHDPDSGSQVVLPQTVAARTTTAPPVPACGEDGFQCVSSGKCVALASVCNFVADCEDASDERHCGSCTFEDGNDDNDNERMCGYEDVPEEDNTRIGWRVRQAEDASALGPSVDHTWANKSGHYLLTVVKESTSSSSLAFFDDAYLFGPIVRSQTSAKCTVRLWTARAASRRVQVQAPLHDDAHLVVSVVNASTRLKIRQVGAVYSTGGNSDSEWRMHSFVVGEVGAGHRLRVIASTDDDTSVAGIAIDDVEMLDCSPWHVRRAEANPCGRGRFTCERY